MILYRVSKKMSLSKPGCGKYCCSLTEIQLKLFDRSKNELSQHCHLAKLMSIYLSSYGLQSQKSTVNPLLVLISCGRLSTPTVSFTWAEFTSLMVPSRENFVCISLITFSLRTLAAGIFVGKKYQQLGQEVQVPCRLWNSIARKTL